MSRKLIAKKCMHCRITYIGGIRQKFCNTECRTDFHNARTSNRRHLPKHALIRSLIYLANQQILEKLHSGRLNQFTRVNLQDHGFHFGGFVDMTHQHFNQLILKYGKLELVYDPVGDLYTIQIGRPIFT